VAGKGRDVVVDAAAVRMSAAGVPVRVAMWSGPRTISTAMMRSFGARPDTLVVDEPLYAYYLAATGRDHPGRAEVLASQPTSWQQVAAALTGPLPPGVRLHYQKHMAQHLLPDVGRGWLGGLRHAYLIREPARLVASYAKVRAEPVFADLGWAQLTELFRAYGGPVVDAADVLRDPAGVLARLCAALGVDYDPAMLSWPAGPRPTDGVWAPHWYATVRASTGFAADNPAPADVPARLRPLVEAVQPYYDELAAHRLG
jgi:hypothetical protein